MKSEKYRSTSRSGVDSIIKASPLCQTHGVSRLCQTCHTALKDGKVPVQLWVNGLSLDNIPSELSNLRPRELRLISQRIPFRKLVAPPRGGQKAIHGNAVNVPAKLKPITTPDAEAEKKTRIQRTLHVLSDPTVASSNFCLSLMRCQWWAQTCFITFTYDCRISSAQLTQRRGLEA